MKLNYRGATYEFNPAKTEMIDTGITARYRGVPYSIRSPHLSQKISSPSALKYRGVFYARFKSLFAI